MRRLTLLCCAAALAGCAKPDQNAAADSTAAPGAMATPATAAIQAGTWNQRAMPMDRDTVISTSTLVTTNDTTGWTITFPNGQPIPVRVLSMQGDSTVIQFTHESPSHPGQQANLTGVSRMQGDSLVGTWEERFVSMPDSVIRGRNVATRAP